MNAGFSAALNRSRHAHDVIVVEADHGELDGLVRIDLRGPGLFRLGNRFKAGPAAVIALGLAQRIAAVLAVASAVANRADASG